MTKHEINPIFLFYKRDNVNIKTQIQLSYYEVLMEIVNTGLFDGSWAIERFNREVQNNSEETIMRFINEIYEILDTLIDID